MNDRQRTSLAICGARGYVQQSYAGRFAGIGTDGTKVEQMPKPTPGMVNVLVPLWPVALPAAIRSPGRAPRRPSRRRRLS